MTASPFDSLTFTFEVSWSTDWNASPSYVDETAYVRGFTIRRGRSSAFDQFPAGTMSVELDNTTRRFDPLYTSGALYPNVLPRKKCRMSYTYSGNTYRRFTGYIDGLAQHGEPSNTLGTVTLTASDGTKILARSRVPTGDATVGDGETIADRVDRLLDYAGWDASARDIDTNTPTVVQMTEDGGFVLDKIYEATNGDLGAFFFAGDGDATYHGHLWQLANNTSAAFTIGESVSASEIPYTDCTFTYDDSLIYNRALCTLQTGTSAFGYTARSVDVSDSASITAYGESARNLGALAVNNENVAQNTAEFVVFHFKDPKLRVSQVAFNPRSTPASQYPMVLSAEIGTRWTFKRRPQNVGSAISQDVIVEGFTDMAGPASFTSTFDLSQAPAEYWLMGSGLWTTGSPSAVWA